MSLAVRSVLCGLCSLLFAVACLYAQPPRSNLSSHNWYFGQNAGLTFVGGSAEVLTNGRLNTLDGSAVASDPITGRLLFYTDGKTVWDSTHTPMPAGTGLLGHESSGQPALIVRKPGSGDIFYIFTTGAANTPNTSTRYSVVDMRANGGRGDVVEKNTLLITNGTEKITATRHCDGRDYWVIGHEWGSNAFRVFPVTAQGVGDPIVSNVGIPYPTSGDIQGTFQVSPNGKTLAVSASLLKSLELFDFDNATGRVTNQRVVGSADRDYYGLEFSPDNTKLYVNTLPFGFNPAHIFQFDLSAGDLTAIRASRYELYEVPGNWQGGQIQLAPDGKMYVSWFSRDSLAVINNPNAKAPACGYVHNGLYLQGKKTNYGLPNFIDSDLPGVTTGFVVLDISARFDRSQAEHGETAVCRIIVCNDAANTVRDVSLALAFPIELKNLNPPPGGGPYLIDSIPASGCDTLEIRFLTGGREGTVSLCAYFVNVAPNFFCMTPDTGCADIKLVAPSDPGDIDYTYYLPVGCAGTVDEVSVLFNSRRFNDTIVDVQFEGEGARYFAYGGDLPIRFVIRPTSDQWFPVVLRRLGSGPVSAVMKLTTSYGDVFRIRLSSAVNPSITPIFDVSEVRVRERTGTFDTCITVMNGSGLGVKLIDSIWIRGPGTSNVRLVSPALPVFVGVGGRTTLCFSITDPPPGLSDTLIIGAQEAKEFCPHCAHHMVVIQGVSSSGPLSSVGREDGTVSILRVIPNPLNEDGTIELSLTKSEALHVAIVDGQGREVLTVAEGRFAPGRHMMPFDGGSLPSGAYTVVVLGEHSRMTRVIHILR